MEPIETLQQEAQTKIQSAASLSELNELRVLYLGKKGPVQELMYLIIAQNEKEIN